MDRMHRAVPRLLTLDEVRAANFPAVFRAFGDHLVFIEGRVYSVPHETDLAHPDLVPHLPDTYVITNSVGIEYGWQHFEGCRCALCAGLSRAAA
jgi:hypothetical protein